MSELRIIIPAHNEQLRIERTVRDYCSHFLDTALICVVLNGCTDSTQQILDELTSEYQNLKVVNIAAAIGKGGAVRAGFILAKETYVGFADADGSTSATEFDRLYARCIRADADGVIASRWIDGAVVAPKQPLKRRIASRVFNQIARTLFGLRFNDTQCGAKIFRRAVLESVFDDLELANFAFDIDLLFQLKRSRARVIEEPTVWSDEAGTKVRLVSSALSMFFALVRLRLLRSWIGGLPYLDFVARQSVIRVSRQQRLLVLAGDYDAAVVAECCSLWTQQGCHVDLVSDPLKSPRLLKKLWARAGFLLWYVLANRRTYDAIIEFSSDIPYLLPAISAKNVFVVGRGQTRIYDLLYRRDTISFVAYREPQALTREIAAAASLNRLYVAQFLLGQEAWSLIYADADSGERREHVLI